MKLTVKCKMCGETFKYAKMNPQGSIRKWCDQCILKRRSARALKWYHQNKGGAV